MSVSAAPPQKPTNVLIVNPGPIPVRTPLPPRDYHVFLLPGSPTAIQSLLLSELQLGYLMLAITDAFLVTVLPHV
jgi:hypothetical protein